MSETVRSRAAARGWVTRLSQKLENLCSRYDQKTFNVIEINDAIEEFDKKLHNLDEAQSRVELEIDMSELENDIGDAADFRERVRQSRIKAATLISAHTTAQPKEADYYRIDKRCRGKTSQINFADFYWRRSPVDCLLGTI